MSPVTLRPAIFLDRDGTLIHDTGYIRDWRQVEMMPGVGEALGKIQGHYCLVLVSNQSGIGRGIITGEEARQVHERTVKLLADWQVHLDGAYYCPHAPNDHCACRKPAPGLLLQAAFDLKIDLSRSIMIGDKPSDVQAGKAVGCRTVFFDSDDLSVSGSGADFATRHWHEIADWILLVGD